MGFEHERLLLAAETGASEAELRLRGDIYLSRVFLLRDAPMLRAGARRDERAGADPAVRLGPEDRRADQQGEHARRPQAAARPGAPGRQAGARVDDRHVEPQPQAPERGPDAAHRVAAVLPRGARNADAGAARPRRAGAAHHVEAEGSQPGRCRTARDAGSDPALGRRRRSSACVPAARCSIPTRAPSSCSAPAPQQRHALPPSGEGATPLAAEVKSFVDATSRLDEGPGLRQPQGDRGVAPKARATT